jgi:hypothetical protein
VFQVSIGWSIIRMYDNLICFLILVCSLSLNMNIFYLKAGEPLKYSRLTMIDEEPVRISCLPGDVIDKIVSHLPIREAVRTSVLSNKWRYKWTTVPNLVFDKQCVSANSRNPFFYMRKLSAIIDHVLLLYSGPINKFKLSDCGVISVTALDR